MRDLLEHVPTRAIDPGDRDEGAPGVVDAPRPETEPLQVLEELVPVLVARADAASPRGHDEIVGPCLAAHQLLESGALPLMEDPRQHRVHGYRARHLGLGGLVVGARDQQALQWTRTVIVVAPAQAGDLTEARACEQLQRVEHPAVPWDHLGADEQLELLAREQCLGAPLGVLVAQLGQLVLGQRAWRGTDYLVDHQVGEELVHRAVDRAYGARRQWRSAQLFDERADVAQADRGERQLAEHWQHVVLELAALVGGVAQAEPRAPFDPALVAAFERRHLVGRAMQRGAGAGVEQLLDQFPGPALLVLGPLPSLSECMRCGVGHDVDLLGRGVGHPPTRNACASEVHLRHFVADAQAVALQRVRAAVVDVNAQGARDRAAGLPTAGNPLGSARALCAFMTAGAWRPRRFA